MKTPRKWVKPFVKEIARLCDQLVSAHGARSCLLRNSIGNKAPRAACRVAVCATGPVHRMAVPHLSHFRLASVVFIATNHDTTTAMTCRTAYLHVTAARPVFLLSSSPPLTSPPCSLSDPFPSFKILWEDRKLGDTGRDCLINVDGIHCRVQRKYTPGGGINKAFYSEKFHDSAVGYETATCIKTGKYVWINGPFTASHGDPGMFCQALRQMLERGEKAEADNGYVGEAPCFVCIPEGKYADPVAEKQKGASRRRHETSNKRLKQWKVLADTFRHDVFEFHRDCFYAAAAMTQIMLEEGELLFPVVYTV